MPKELTPENLAFVAGVIEAQGVFDMGFSTRASKTLTPTLKVNTLSPILAYKLKGLVGGGVSKRPGDASKNRSPLFSWKVSSSAVVRLGEQLRPYLFEKQSFFAFIDQYRRKADRIADPHARYNFSLVQKGYFHKLAQDIQDGWLMTFGL